MSPRKVDMRVIKWILGKLGIEKIEELPVDPKPQLSKHDPNWLRQRNNLHQTLDDICIKHHGCLPYESRMENDEY